MSGLSRRTFIGGAAAGAVAVTAVAVPGMAAAVPEDDSPDSRGNELDLPEPVIARVCDLRTGEIALYVGTDEITHTDPTLARRLARAAGR